MSSSTARRELVREAAALVLGEDLGVDRHDRSRPLRVRREPGERVADVDLVAGPLPVVDDPHGPVGIAHPDSLADPRPAPVLMRRRPTSCVVLRRTRSRRAE